MSAQWILSSKSSLDPVRVINAQFTMWLNDADAHAAVLRKVFAPEREPCQFTSGVLVTSCNHSPSDQIVYNLEQIIKVALTLESKLVQKLLFNSHK